MCDSADVSANAQIWKVCIMTLGSVVGNLFDPYKNTTTFDQVEFETGVEMAEIEQTYSTVLSILMILSVLLCSFFIN